jgi:prepilin signal peptidase PulO-like enzyme (type II secretory pathway)
MTVILLSLGAGILGLFVGALMNARILRSPESLAFTTNRTCATCAVPVSATESLPVVGYLAMRGRCRKCLSIVPWQYPATEIAIGLLFAAFAARALLHFELPDFVTPDEVGLLFVRDALMVVALSLVFMFDYRASVIPDRVTIPAMIVALVCNILLGADVGMMLFGGLILGSFFAVQYLLSGGRWVGGGDIRMGLLMGLLLGPVLGIVGLFLSYIFGAIIGIFLIIMRKRDMNSHVPFGTFLALATCVCMFIGERLLTWYMGLFS